MIAPVLVNPEQEQWNKVHAQLLKSVADAQAKLLAAQNETNDRLEGLAERLTTLTVSAAALNANHAGLKGDLSGKLDAAQRGIYLHIEQHADAILARMVEVIETKLTRPRRQVEPRNAPRARQGRDHPATAKGKQRR